MDEEVQPCCEAEWESAKMVVELRGEPGAHVSQRTMQRQPDASSFSFLRFPLPTFSLAPVAAALLPGVRTSIAARVAASKMSWMNGRKIMGNSSDEKLPRQTWTRARRHSHRPLHSVAMNIRDTTVRRFVQQ